jgi:hypothetical protein
MPEKHQLPILQSKARFKVIVWHRKAHKTTLAINQLLRMAALVKGTYWYVAPFYGEAKETIWQDSQMLPKYCPPEIWEKRNNSELYIPFPNGSMLFVKGSDKPDALRGPNPQGVVLDEYATMKSDTWSAVIQPIMTANPHSWTWFMGTPKGKNDLWTKLQYAKDNPNWYSSVLKASESGIISKDSLEEAKKTSPQALYNQEYECDFLEGASQVFRRIHQNTYNKEEQQTEYGDFQLGVDLAKHQDWTVLTPFNLNTFRAYVQDRFNQVDWNLQKARIEATALRYKARVKIDATGIGDPVVDDLKSRGLNIGEDDAIKFTEVTRANLLNHLSMLLEQDKIQIPNDEGLINELESFQYKLIVNKETNKTRIAMISTAPNDDRVMSLALAVHGKDTPTPIDWHERNPRFANREQEGNLYQATYD